MLRTLSPEAFDFATSNDGKRVMPWLETKAEKFGWDYVREALQFCFDVSPEIVRACIEALRRSSVPDVERYYRTVRLKYATEFQKILFLTSCERTFYNDCAQNVQGYSNTFRRFLKNADEAQYMCHVSRYTIPSFTSSAIDVRCRRIAPRIQYQIEKRKSTLHLLKNGTSVLHLKNLKLPVIENCVQSRNKWIPLGNAWYEFKEAPLLYTVVEDADAYLTWYCGVLELNRRGAQDRMYVPFKPHVWLEENKEPLIVADNQIVRVHPLGEVVESQVDALMIGDDVELVLPIYRHKLTLRLSGSNRTFLTYGLEFSRVPTYHRTTGVVFEQTMLGDVVLDLNASAREMVAAFEDVLGADLCSALYSFLAFDHRPRVT